MSNVIDMTRRLKVQATAEALEVIQTGDILNIAELRKKMISDDRRQVKRTILTEFISLHAVVPEKGILRVSLYDINEHGLSFDLEAEKGHYNVGDMVELRIYLNHQTYFKIETRVMHATEVIDEGVSRHGCEFTRDTLNMEALSHFVQFLECVTANLRRDGGDILVSKINS
jgi:hypothetical protein